jgi:hypothetical protein
MLFDFLRDVLVWLAPRDVAARVPARAMSRSQMMMRMMRIRA